MEALGHVQSDRRLDILRQIGELGSISKAARAVGVSYKAAWQAVDTLTNLSGVALLDRAVGGRGGGGAQLTEEGRQLLAAAQALKSARAQAVHSMQDQVVPGMDAAKGNPLAAAARLAVRTSMRNQWPCEVSAMDVQGHLVRVFLHAEGMPDFRVCSRITLESAELLGLHKGIPVQVLCKATAVAVLPASSVSSLAETNCWSASVTRVSRGGLGDEVSATVGKRLQVVGFSEPGMALRANSKVVMRIDESSVVLAVE